MQKQIMQKQIKQKCTQATFYPRDPGLTFYTMQNNNQLILQVLINEDFQQILFNHNYYKNIKSGHFTIQKVIYNIVGLNHDIKILIYIFLMLDNNCTKPASQYPAMTFSQRLSEFEKQHNYTAYIYATISNVCFVILQMNMKIVSIYIHPLHALAIRGFFLLVINSIIIHFHGITMNIKQPQIFTIMMKRIFWSALTVSMLLAPLKYIPAGTVNALFNTAPIIVCFVEAFRYKKPLNFKHLMLTAISFLGILLIIQPQFLFGSTYHQYQQYKYLMFFSLAAAFTNSFSMSYLHDLKGKVPTTIALHYFYIGQCLFNSLAMTFQQNSFQNLNLDLKFYLAIAGLVVSAYFTQNFMTRAIMLKKPSYIMPLGYITIILSALCDYVYFGNQFSTLSIIGMFLTSSGLLVKLLVPEDERKNSARQIKQNNEQQKPQKEYTYLQQDSLTIN